MTFAAMQTWFSYHIYPLEAPEVFLARGLRPFLEQNIWPTPGARAFFIRYEDEHGFHIRLRLRGEDQWLRQNIQPTLEEAFAERGTLEEVPYLPETDRFGDATALDAAEQHFHLSTRVVLDRLNRPYTYGDALFDALRLHLITAYALQWQPERCAWYFGELCNQWMDLFFQPAGKGATGESDWRASLKADFEESFAPQRNEVRNALSELWTALDKGKFDPDQPEWLRWLRGNQLILPELGEQLDKSLPSLIHLTNNRLGLNNQDEVYLNFMLSRVFQL